ASVSALISLLNGREALDYSLPGAFPVISAAFAALSAGLSLPEENASVSGALKGCCLGTALISAFLIFSANNAEIALAAVPAVTAQSALEIKAMRRIIKKDRNE
ncbi:MAG: hypothetical protein J5793_03550, partial [Clostridia bacterium]|nr:hypothetical protein [Clostridia bacterium]